MLTVASPSGRAGYLGATESDSTIPVRFDFSALKELSLPAGFTTFSFTRTRAADFRLATVGNRRALADEPGPDGDVLYYTGSGPLASIKESFAFVYSGPDSIVEPFIVNAHPRRPKAVGGFLTNLRASLPSPLYHGGSVSFVFADDAGQLQNIGQGRLRSEPYFYRVGHTYRVDAIADNVSGVLGARVYDVALGPQTFDTSIKKIPQGFSGYPGLIARAGNVAITDFSFGANGSLPVAPTPARRAQEYMNYLGYNAATGGALTSPASQAFVHFFPQLLIRHVRLPDNSRYLPSINAVARYGIDASVLTSNTSTLDGLRRFIAALALPPDSIELWNEPNNPSMGNSYDAQYAVRLPSFAAAVRPAFPKTPIWGPSVLPNHEGYPTDAIKLANSVGPLITAWNAHSYTVATPENLGYGGFISDACGPTRKEDCGWYGAPNFNDNESAVINPDLPGITSEGAASYQTYPEICGHGAVDLATQQAYVERGMLYNFKLGHLRIFPYKFIDDGGCNDGGGTDGIMSQIVEQDGSRSITPKPAFVSLVSFDHLLADAGPKASDFDPQPLAYALGGTSPDVEELALAESDGTYRLILWSDAPLWDFNANGRYAPGNEVPLVARHVDVRFPTPMRTTVYTQTAGTGKWSASRPRRATSIAVTVDQYPLVLAIRAGSSDDESGVSLPRDVPTPGPLETPHPKAAPRSQAPQ